MASLDEYRRNRETPDEPEPEILPVLVGAGCPPEGRACVNAARAARLGAKPAENRGL